MSKLAKIATKMVAHSVNPHGGELISIQGYAPYFLDAELEKHGMIMSNSSSNRAIPFKKMVEAEFFVPPDIRKEAKGMQGFQTLDFAEEIIFEERISRVREIVVAELLDIQSKLNVHKQTLNRYIAPWSMQTKIMTGTRESWIGVLALRDHRDADPSVQIWAKEVKFLLETSTPMDLDYGEWHLPYITLEERDDLAIGIISIEQILKISSARCARTSYRLFDGAIALYEEDYKLFNKLVGSDPIHATPLEHQGLCIRKECDNNPAWWQRGQTHMMRDGSVGSGRMIGWIQNRHWWKYDI